MELEFEQEVVVPSKVCPSCGEASLKAGEFVCEACFTELHDSDWELYT